MKTVNSIMLIDDYPPTNLILERAIVNNTFAHEVLNFTAASGALKYLKEPFIRLSQRPNMIFLDSNMTGIGGWEFLQEYETLTEMHRSEVIISMLNTSTQPQDSDKAKANPLINKFLNKPLTKELLERLIKENL